MTIIFVTVKFVIWNNRNIIGLLFVEILNELKKFHIKRRFLFLCITYCILMHSYIHCMKITIRKQNVKKIY